MQTLTKWLSFGSSNVSDALRSCGKAFQAMDGGIRPLSSDMAVAGPAYTVRCYPGATWALERALELAPAGSVLVVDGNGFSDAILMGGLMSTRMKMRGIAGAIVDGAVRDVEDIVTLNFPVFSRFICPRAGTFAEIGEWDTTICCGRVPVRSGDWIVADRSGIAVIPPDLLSDVYQAAEAIHYREQRMTDQLALGNTLAEASKAARAATAEVAGAAH